MLTSLKRSIVLGLIVVAAAGCNKSPSPAETPASEATKPAAANAEKAPPPDKVAAAAESVPAVAEVTLKDVTYEQLKDAVRAAKGKIVVMDFWANWCIPCKKSFPELVTLHERHRLDGVVCMSVTVDEKANRDGALAFLKQKNATFANYLLDEKDDFWQKNLQIKSVPAVMVFNREGGLVRRFNEDKFTYDDVNKVVDDLLKPAP